MPHLASRPWVPAASEALIQRLARETSAPSDSVTARIEALITRNLAIHDHECFNLNPATNVMNPKAEAVLARGLGSRPSLGYPGDKYEMGLEAIEAIEVIRAELAAEVFQAKYAEIRVGSGALANLYGFMALTRPGDAIIAPDPAIGGHVTHHATGCAGLYGLITHAAPVDADVVGAHLLFDAAHQCVMIAGGRFPNPLSQGAHLMTMSTYKSLGGPAGGLIVTNDAAIAERLDAIAFPGMTVNFDAGKSAALALTLLDWRDFGAGYATAMVDLAQAFAAALAALGLPVHAIARGATQSHQFALQAAGFGGGQAASKTLRKAGFLACGIGLPIAAVPGDMNGLRIGTPELVRRGVTPSDAPALAALIAEALRSNAPETVAPRTRALQARFQGLHYMR